MKKKLSLLLSAVMTLALLVCVFLSAVPSSAAEEIDVTVGSKFEYNSRGETDATRTHWREGDSMWVYQYYHANEQIWRDMVYDRQNNRWQTPNDLFNYAYVRQYGKELHPAKKAETVKTFIAPASGTINMTIKAARVTEWTEKSSGTPTSMRVLINDELVYPTDGNEYVTLTSATEQTYTIPNLQVYKEDRVRIAIGSIGENNGADGVYLSSTVVYTTVSEDENPHLDQITDNATTTKDTSDVTEPGSTGSSTGGSTATGSMNTPGGANGVSPVVIVVIVVAVIVIAAVVIILIRKKRAEAEYYEEDGEEDSEDNNEEDGESEE